MAIKYIFCDTGLTDWDAWQVSAKEAVNAYYISQNPSTGACEVRVDYEDRITNTIADSEVRLADDKTTFHSDRFIDPYIDHPSDSKKIIGLFDDSETDDPLKIAYYCAQSWRDANVGSALTIIDQEEAESEGFIFDTE